MDITNQKKIVIIVPSSWFPGIIKDFGELRHTFPFHLQELFVLALPSYPIYNHASLRALSSSTKNHQ